MGVDMKKDIFDFEIQNIEDLKAAITRLGFLPFFKNSLPSFSIEEHISPELWFTDAEGPWEWKGSVIRDLKCAYGKFFEKKAAFISKEWFLDFANYRRDGYDFDARFDDGLAQYKDKNLYELLESNAPILSKDLKKKGNYVKGGNKGFDTVMNRLQAECYVITNDFVYNIDKYGNPYGWGVAEYNVPEKFLGKSFTDNVYLNTPKESFEKILAHFKTLFPDVEEKKIIKFIG